MASKSTALVAPQPALLPTPAIALTHDGLWVGTADFAAVAGISRQAAHKALFQALNNHTWRGTSLDVRAIDGAGGRGGKALQVYIPSLPADLRAIWHKRNPRALDAPAVSPIQFPAPAVIDLCIGNRVAEMKWKSAIVGPALLQPKGSKARAAILKDIAARPHQGLHGKSVQVAVDTLRDWLTKIEAGNEGRLARQRRADAGNVRYHVNSKWDKACPLPDTEKRIIAAALEDHIRGQHRNLATERKIDALASAKLQELAKDAGWLAAPLIRPGLHLVRKFKSSRLPGIQEKDAKLFHDKYRPSIHRRRPRWPMECVFGDVHPDDILYVREDGTEATARMIAWFDMASHDVFYTLVPLPKGKGITQADIVESFIEMVQAWGLPRRLYLDNGSEYMDKDFIAGLEMLQGLCCGFFSLHLDDIKEIAQVAGIETADPDEDPKLTVRARAYNARAKVIEAFFSWLNKFLQVIPGYIGGDRMRKKTHNVGKRPAPFPGPFVQLRDGAHAEAVAFYRNEPQGGSMGWKSPNQFKREAYADPAYIPPPAADEATLLAAFGKSHIKPVQHGGIKFTDGEDYWYWDDELISVMGEKIAVHRVKCRPDIALWIKPDGAPVLLRRDINYDPFAHDGAKEQSRREGLMKRHVTGIRRISPPTDAVADMARYNAALPAPPVTPIGARILLSAKTQAIADAVRDEASAPVQPPEKLPHGAYREKNGVVMLPARIAPAPEPERFDIFNQPPRQKTKTDASADAPVFDVLASYAKNPPLNNHEKETEQS